MKYIKSHYESALRDEFLQMILMIGNTTSKFQLSYILKLDHSPSLPQEKNVALVCRLAFQKKSYSIITIIFWILSIKTVEICFLCYVSTYTIFSILPFDPWSLKYLLSGSLQKKLANLLTIRPYMFWSLSVSLTSCSITFSLTYFTPTILISLLSFNAAGMFPSQSICICSSLGLGHLSSNCKYTYSLNFQVLLKYHLSETFPGYLM